MKVPISDVETNNLVQFIQNTLQNDVENAYSIFTLVGIAKKKNVLVEVSNFALYQRIRYALIKLKAQGKVVRGKKRQTHVFYWNKEVECD